MRSLVWRVLLALQPVITAVRGAHINLAAPTQRHLLAGVACRDLTPARQTWHSSAGDHAEMEYLFSVNLLQYEILTRRRVQTLYVFTVGYGVPSTERNTWPTHYNTLLAYCQTIPADMNICKKVKQHKTQYSILSVMSLMDRCRLRV